MVLLIVQFAFIHSHLLLLLQSSSYVFLPPLTLKMAWNSDFDRVWNQIVHETLHDNTDEEIMRYLCHVKQQTKNIIRPIRTRRVINCNRGDKHSCLMNDYFYENYVYIETQFQQRFQMSKQLFLRIVDALVIVIHISNWDPMHMVEWVFYHYRRALQQFIYWHTDHLHIVLMSMLELVKALQLNA